MALQRAHGRFINDGTSDIMLLCHGASAVVKAKDVELTGRNWYWLLRHEEHFTHVQLSSTTLLLQTNADLYCGYHDGGDVVQSPAHLMPF